MGGGEKEVGSRLGRNGGGGGGVWRESTRWMAGKWVQVVVDDLGSFCHQPQQNQNRDN